MFTLAMSGRRGDGQPPNGGPSTSESTLTRERVVHGVPGAETRAPGGGEKAGSTIAKSPPTSREIGLPSRQNPTLKAFSSGRPREKPLVSVLGGKRTLAADAAQHALARAQTPAEQGTAWRATGLVQIENEQLKIENLAVLNSQRSMLNSPSDYFAESVRIFAAAGLQGERARTLREWARYEIARGNRASGELLWREVRAVFMRLGMDGEVRAMNAFLTL